jgi:hypothetical protein
MLLSGILTCTMLVGLISPETSLKSNFGESLEKPVFDIIVRNWSALIFLMGIMLIYGSFVPSVRRFVLIIAGISKITFISLVLSLGQQYLAYGIGTAVIVDSIMIALYMMYLIFSKSTTA